MNEGQFKHLAKGFFKEFRDIDLRDIPQQDQRTPDFETSIGIERYTLELKIKDDDPKDIQNREELLKKGEIVKTTTLLSPRNTLSGIIEDGVNQLNEFDPSRNSFQIVWLHCEGQNPSIHWERFHATLYGTETLVSRGCGSMLWCYYYYDSSFFRYREKLDGALLTKFENELVLNDATAEASEGMEVQLCINSLSSRADLFRRSELAKKLSQALCDPISEESRGALIADCDFDRKIPIEIIKYLKTKYKISHLQVMPVNNINVSAKLEDDRL
ncbi:MAG: hypothetical protein L0196_08480 [candidate division Zixibacteria bacterium]|nr:hypothetical protein [candidate division Zixibacteria bacterium]